MIKHSVASFRPCSAILCLPALLAALVLAPPALSQTATDPSTPPATLTYDQAWMQAIDVESRHAKGFASIGYSPAILTIPHQPFTAHRVYKEWARNGDSGTPAVTTTVTVARDDLGRIHYESSRQPGEVTVMISDPVEHLNYRYEITPDATANLTADRCIQPRMSQISKPNTGPDPAAASNVDPNAAATTPAVTAAPPPPVRQELGTQTLEGALAYGQQRTEYLMLDTGLKTMWTQDWFSPVLGLNLKELSDYTGQNRSIVETRDVQLGDPDPNLFVLPAGYALPGPTQSCIPLIS